MPNNKPAILRRLNALVQVHGEMFARSGWKIAGSHDNASFAALFV